jgi:radical SAM superfamily enzyme YgiQ (UPF0313 family)
VAAEIGTVRKEAPTRIALVYPSPYRVAMASLGYQAIYRRLNQLPGIAADRAMLPDELAADQATRTPLLTLEREQPVGAYPIVAFSIASELEIAGAIACLELAGLAPLAADRPDDGPLVVAGGPLTFSNPAPLGPFFDVILLGEAEDLVAELAELAHAGDRAAALARFADRPGVYVPARHGDRVPAVAQAADHHLPARSQIVTPASALASMFLTEAARGCSRGCTYCVMRRSTNGGMRVVPRAEILAGIPDHARRVGLVGAAVTDHPEIVELVRELVAGGREVGISSLRADRLTDELVGLLRAGGYRTLTVALDGASEELRRRIERRHTEADLVRAVELARHHRLQTLKVYMMVGLPGETDADIDELCRFGRELARIHPRIALGVAPFVAKRQTPLDGTPFAGVGVVDGRLRRLRRGLKGAATVRPTSARWAWVEYMLAQGGAAAGRAVLDAHASGGTYAAYQRAFAARECVPTGPVARVPSTPELIALRRAQRRA